MSAFETYKNLKRVTPAPDPILYPGGDALNDNFTYIGDILESLATSLALKASNSGLVSLSDEVVDHVNNITNAHDIHLKANAADLTAHLSLTSTAHGATAVGTPNTLMSRDASANTEVNRLMASEVATGEITRTGNLLIDVTGTITLSATSITASAEVTASRFICADGGNAIYDDGLIECGNLVAASQVTCANFASTTTGMSFNVDGLTLLTLESETGTANFGLFNVTAANLSGSLNASNLTGSIADARLSANVALKNANNNFSTAQTVNGQVNCSSLSSTGGVSCTAVTASTTVTATRRITAGVVALTDGATIATDASLGNTFTVTLGGNRSMPAPTNAVAGQKIVYQVRQDATGSRTISWQGGTGGFRFSGGTAPTLTTTAAKTDYIGFSYNAVDSRWDCIAERLNF